MTPNTTAATTTTATLPLRPIPGSYGLPILGPLKDRLDFFWFQGPEPFFRNRIIKHKSTVFRTNVPPTFPFFLKVNPNMIALLDCQSFSTLFDNSLVEKKNVLVGDYMPSLGFTGNLRVLAYLDTTEPGHTAVKNFAMDILKSSSRVWQSELVKNLGVMWDGIDEEIEKNGSAGVLIPLQNCLFRFLTKSLIGADTTRRPEIDKAGFGALDAWLALQLLPTVQTRALPQPLEEIFLHSFPFPAFLASPGYNKLYEFVEEEGKEVVEKGTKAYGLTKEETIHNLLFILGFNAFGGFSVFLPTLISRIGTDKMGLQEKLRKEAREESKSGLDFSAVSNMDLIRSTVCEALRLKPPVPFQYARARKDFVLSSHESSFEVKKGELLCGYQPIVMKDPKVFDRPEEFVPERFSGGKMLEYLYWSNGPQTGMPSVENKQCAAKDYVVATCCLIVAWIFIRYDEFRCDDSGQTVTKIVKATTNTTPTTQAADVTKE